jgi:mycothiol synthase
MEWNVRRYQGEEDVPAITALANAVAEVDGPEYGRTEQETRRILSGPTAMAEDNAFLVLDSAQLVAFGRVEMEEGPGESIFFTRGHVHPQWRRQGIGTLLMHTLETRARERLGEAKNQAVQLRAWTNLVFKGQVALFESMGYELRRYFFDMERPVTEGGAKMEIPAPVYPEGITRRTLAERHNLRAVWQATDEAFRDHWGHTDTTLEQWEHWISDPNHRPDHWVIAWDDAQDEVAGVCMTGIEPEHIERIGRNEGWVYVLAVRRPYRGRGLGSALLLDGARIIQGEGMDFAMLDVDTENLTGALRLYEQAGFRAVKKSGAFQKALRS